MQMKLFESPFTTYNQEVCLPEISENAYIHQLSCVIGNVEVSDNVFIAPFASVRADEGSPIFIGKNSNIQDCVVIHGLKGKFVEVNNQHYSVYIGENTSLAHQSMVHGPAVIGNNVFVGFQSLVYDSKIGNNVMIDHGAKVIGVDIPANKYIPVGAVIRTQYDIEHLQNLDECKDKQSFNQKVLDVNAELVKGYIELDKKH